MEKKVILLTGANSGIGLWHWGIGLAVTALSIGHITKRWHTLRNEIRNTQKKA